jgi:DNA-binding NarL/FixJ family response regulator
MTKDDLRFVADALLALCEPDPSRPFYSEEAFDHKLKLAYHREPKLIGLILVKHLQDDLLAHECEDVLDAAGLTCRQLEVLQMRIEGYTFEEIGARGNHTKQGAQNIFVQALKKLGRSCRVYRYEGLSEVYRSELRRGLRPKAFGRMP